MNNQLHKISSCGTIIMYLLADYRRYELAQSKVDHTQLGHHNRDCKIGRVRILHCGKHRPEGKDDT